MSDSIINYRIKDNKYYVINLIVKLIEFKCSSSAAMKEIIRQQTQSSGIYDPTEKPHDEFHIFT